MSQDQVLDLFGADFFTASIDQILFASLDHIVAGRMLSHQIPGAIETVGREGEGVVLGRTVIAAKDGRAARQKFTDYSRSDFIIVCVQMRNLVVGAETPP